MAHGVHNHNAQATSCHGIQLSHRTETQLNL